MGRDKALLEMDGKPLLALAAERLEPLVREVKVIGPPSRYAGLGYPVLADSFGVQSPLVGLATGLRASCCDWNLFLATDMPCVEASLLRRIAECTIYCGAQAVIPQVGDYWEPLCAAYHRSCLPAMEAAIAENRLSVVGLIPHMVVACVPVATGEIGMLKSVNTEQDWQRVQCLAMV